MSRLATRIAENLAHIRGRIATAAGKRGRASNEIKLVAVTKYVDADLAAALVEAGCHDLGESRPQELWAKAAALSTLGANAAMASAVRWHLIGHLQRNKIRRTIPLVHWIQSVDSRRLLEALEEEAAALGRPAIVLLETNISGESSKTGLAQRELEPLLAEAGRWPHVFIRGLMGMSGLAGGADAAKRDFERLAALRDQLVPNLPPSVTLTELSMGMSDDFEIAIEAGATMVRIGSALFEGVAQ